MRRGYLLLLLAIGINLLSSFFAFSAGVGYQIDIKLKDAKTEMLYLEGYYGKSSFIVDSAIGRKDLFRFKSKKQELNPGIYTVLTQEYIPLFQLILEESTRVRIETHFDSPLDFYFIKKSEKNKIFLEYQKSGVSGEGVSLYMETSPHSLLTEYIRAMVYNPIESIEYQILFKDTIPHEHELNQYMMKHYFDGVNFEDVRLLRTPMSPDLRFYFTELLMATYDHECDWIEVIDHFLDGTIDAFQEEPNREAQVYYTNQLMRIFMSNHPRTDTLFVYLFDHYFDPTQDQWGIYDESYQRVYPLVAERKRQSFVNHTIESITAYNGKGEEVSTSDIQADYTILWFWDPDCDECVIETPILYKFYKNFKSKYSFEVFAVSVTDDLERWNHFSQEYEIDWINLSYAMGDPNYDLLDFFDLVATPGLFIIDKNHKIIGRHIPLNKLGNFFEEYTTNIIKSKSK